MASCIVNARTSRYLPSQVKAAAENYSTDFFSYDFSTDSIDCKLLAVNPYRSHLRQVYPSEIDEHDLNEDMLAVVKSYTDSATNECYMKTNLNLLSAHLDEIDWTYVNKLRSLIRGLVQSNVKPMYYRGLHLSNTEIRFYMERCHGYYYTNSFLSFTIDRLLIYPGNAVILLRTDTASDEAKKNLANIWTWSACVDEKEALLAVGTKLKVSSVHYLGCKWEIEVELADD